MNNVKALHDQRRRLELVDRAGRRHLVHGRVVLVVAAARAVVASVAVVPVVAAAASGLVVDLADGVLKRVDHAHDLHRQYALVVDGDRAIAHRQQRPARAVNHQDGDALKIALVSRGGGPLAVAVLGAGRNHRL